MKKTKRIRLEARGWRVGSAKDFLGLRPEEAALVETRLTLSRALRAKREALHLTQSELARRLKSSQSRVAKMEAGDKTVSVDLLVKALFSLGARPKDVGRALRRGSAAA
jgi:ribosome-binding protein aMBF1 (putative translation factor)